MINFTHFNQKKKHSHQYLQNCAYIQNATVIVHICTVTVALHINILLISHFAPIFFSLFSIYKTNSVIFSPSSSSSSFDTHKHTHHPPNTVQPSPPNHHHDHLLKQPPPPKPVKTTETQNTTKIKPNQPKIHRKSTQN